MGLEELTLSERKYIGSFISTRKKTCKATNDFEIPQQIPLIEYNTKTKNLKPAKLNCI